MSPAQLELMGIRLGDIQDRLAGMENKEDVLLAMLEHVQETLAKPQIVTPRFPAWVGWLVAGYLTVSSISTLAVILLLWQLTMA